MYSELLELYRTKKTSHVSTQHPDFYGYVVSSTGFLTRTPTFTQRLWHIHNNTFSIPLCKQCGTTVKWNNKEQAYRSFCSNACAGMFVSTQHKKQQSPPPCIICNKYVSWNSTTHSWNNTCSTKCRCLHESKLTTTAEEMFITIHNLPSDYNYRKMVTQYRPVFNKIRELTSHLPNHYQIKKRISWLCNQHTTREEHKQAQLELLGHVNVSVRYARATNNLKTLKCKECDNDRVFNVTTSRFSTFCSVECKVSWEKRKIITKLIDTMNKLFINPKEANLVFDNKLKKAGRSVIRIGEYNHSHSPVLVQCLDCNYQWKAQPTKLIGSNATGCPRCRTEMGLFGKFVDYNGIRFRSMLERDCYIYLQGWGEIHGVTIETQKKYPQSNTNHTCDFFVPELELWIEVSSIKTKPYMENIIQKHKWVIQHNHTFLFINSYKQLKEIFDGKIYME